MFKVICLIFYQTDIFYELKTINYLPHFLKILTACFNIRIWFCNKLFVRRLEQKQKHCNVTPPVWKFCHGASQAPTRKTRSPTWVSRQDKTANETPNRTKAYLMAQFGPNLAPFLLWVSAILNQCLSHIKIFFNVFIYSF